MDTHLNPAVAQFQLWDSMLTAYNGDWHDKIVKNASRWYSPLRHRPYLDTRLVLDGYIDDHINERIIVVRHTSHRRQVDSYLFALTESGKFKVSYPADRSIWRFLERQSFFRYYPIRGAIALFLGDGMMTERSWQRYSPHNFETRYPYVPHTAIRGVWYRAEQDLAGKWRLGLYVEDNPGWADAPLTVEQWANDLEAQYMRSERLYRNRRRRHFRNAGIPDPLAIQTVVQHLDGNALAKAFPIYRPAPVTFPERKPFSEASVQLSDEPNDQMPTSDSRHNGTSTSDSRIDCHA